MVLTQCFDPFISLEISIPKSLVQLHNSVHENCTVYFEFDCLITRLCTACKININICSICIDACMLNDC